MQVIHGTLREKQDKFFVIKSLINESLRYQVALHNVIICSQALSVIATYLILIISKHLGPQLSHFWIVEVRIAGAT